MGEPSVGEDYTPPAREGAHHRHGRKDEEGRLSREGEEDARNDAREMFERIVQAENGTVFSITSSDIARSVETTHIIEQEIKRLAFRRQRGGCDDVMVLSMRRDGKDAIQRLTKDKSRKYVIVDNETDPELGYANHDSGFNKENYDALQKFLNNDEALVAYLWAAQPDELDGPDGLLKYLYTEVVEKNRDRLSEEEIAHIEARFQEMTDPRQHLSYTPEDLAIHQLKAYERHFKQMDEDFPENKTDSTFIGHAPGCDFVALALFNQRISWKNYQAIGGYRDFFEAHSFQVIDGSVVFVDFRNNRSSSEPIKISDIIARLQSESEERKRAWGTWRA